MDSLKLPPITVEQAKKIVALTADLTENRQEIQDDAAYIVRFLLSGNGGLCSTKDFMKACEIACKVAGIDV